MSRLSRLTILIIGILFLVLSMWIVWTDLSELKPQGFTLLEYSVEFLREVASDMSGIAFALLILNSLNEFRENHRQKTRLVLEVGSGHNTMALRALEELDALGWLEKALRRAALWQADLRKARLGGVKRKLRKRPLKGILYDDGHVKWFEPANELKVDMGGANLFEADLSEANLIKANLEGVYLQGARLVSAALSQANLKRSDLRQANLQFADLQSTNLIGATLQNANLDHASLWRASLFDCDLTGVNLNGCRVDNNSLLMAKALTGAIMPNGMHHKEWMQHYHAQKLAPWTQLERYTGRDLATLRFHQEFTIIEVDARGIHLALNNASTVYYYIKQADFYSAWLRLSQKKEMWSGEFQSRYGARKARYLMALLVSLPDVHYNSGQSRFDSDPMWARFFSEETQNWLEAQPLSGYLIRPIRLFCRNSDPAQRPVRK